MNLLTLTAHPLPHMQALAVAQALNALVDKQTGEFYGLEPVVPDDKAEPIIFWHVYHGWQA